MNQWLTLGFYLVVFSVSVAHHSVGRKAQEKVPEVDATCLNCICQASSNCDETRKCVNAGANSYLCGPYVISWAYWYDGGRPGDKGGDHDFETCLNNKTCAEEAVRGYMRRYGQDCDKSGTIDCYDFARIHKLGFGSCGDSAIENFEYWQKFEKCWKGAIQARSGRLINGQVNGQGHQSPYYGNIPSFDIRTFIFAVPPGAHPRSSYGGQGPFQTNSQGWGGMPAANFYGGK